MTDDDDDYFVVVAGKMLTWSEHQQHQTSVGEMMSMSSLLVDQCAGVFCTMMIGASLYVWLRKSQWEIFFVFVCSVKIFFVWRRNATSRKWEMFNQVIELYTISSPFPCFCWTTTTTAPMSKRSTSPAFRASPPACVLSVPVKFYLSGGWADQNSLYRTKDKFPGHNQILRALVQCLGSMILRWLLLDALTHHEPQL